MEREFDGRVVFITGGASGMSRATALAFGREGATVVIADISDQGAQVKGEIEAAGGKADFHQGDMTDEAAVSQAVAAAVERHGRIDHAFNNVGGARGSLFEDSTAEDFDFTVAVGMKAPWLAMKYQLPQMVRQGRGTIVNTASLSGFTYQPSGSAIYSATKAAVISMTEYAAMYYADKGVRVNVVSPGLTATPPILKHWSPEKRAETFNTIMAIHRMVEPEEIADGVLFLSSDRSAMITGVNLPICGGGNGVSGAR